MRFRAFLRPSVYNLQRSREEKSTASRRYALSLRRFSGGGQREILHLLRAPHRALYRHNYSPRSPSPSPFLLLHPLRALLRFPILFPHIPQQESLPLQHRCPVYFTIVCTSSRLTVGIVQSKLYPSTKIIQRKRLQFSQLRRKSSRFLLDLNSNKTHKIPFTECYSYDDR